MKKIDKVRINFKIPKDLNSFFKSYAEAKRTNRTQLIVDYIVGLQSKEATYAK